jgi:hypothetical protein
MRCRFIFKSGWIRAMGEFLRLAAMLCSDDAFSGQCSAGSSVAVLMHIKVSPQQS